jgi:transposase
MNLTRINADLAKPVFQLHGIDRLERTVWRRKPVHGDWIKELLERIEPG